MPDTKYQRDTHRMDCSGLDLNRPVDSVKLGKWPYLKNVRQYQAGRLEPRLGLTDIAAAVAGQSPVHSARRLNDPANATYARIIGAGTHLAYGQASFTDIDSGYSGDPLALVPWKPLASPTPYMYVGDRSRMRKISRAGVLDTIGLAAPATAPSIALSSPPQYAVVTEADATAGWGATGTAGAISLLSAGPGLRVNTTIAQIVYDTGTTGWCTISPTSAANIGVGSRLTINSGGGSAEITTTVEVHPASTATTIGSIVYDSGTSGAASIVLATPIEQVQLHGMIRNSTVGPENCTIQSVSVGPDGATSLRITTTNTWAAGNTVTVLASYRTYTASNHAATETITTDGLRSTITVGTGSLSRTQATDLSLFTTGVPTRPDDYMHISLRVDRPDLVSEIKVLLDVDIATNDFTRNFYSHIFRASDLTPSTRNIQPIIGNRATVIQRTLIDDTVSGPVSGGVGGRIVESSRLHVDQVTTEADSDIATSQQMASGDVQWVELMFRLSDLIRVGTDDSRTLKDVAVIRLTAITTGTVVLDWDSWWVGGGYGPDVADIGVPYFYRYRARVPATNVPSNWSPATRGGVLPLRQSVTVTLTQYAAPSGTTLTAATDIVLDVERFGGEIADWHYAGTVPNAASPSFTDIYPDSTVGGNPIIGNENYQPWPILGVPVSGTSGTIAGTTINDAATSFNLSWAPGTRILIANQPYTIYRVISTSRMELVENAGNQSAVTWRIDEPTILAQPLPCLWEQGDVFFGCGDPVNPGRLYYSNPKSETTTPDRWLDLTSPSEPLMNGLSYNIRSYVFSSDNFFQVLTTGDADIPFRWEQIPNGKGLFSRWALTREPAPFIDFLSRDGIYRTAGGTPSSLTDGDLYPLFPNEGNLGSNVNGVFAPNVVSAQATGLRLSYYDGYTYFDYAAISGGMATLVLASNPDDSPLGWFWDIYTPNVQFHYGEEGSGVHSILCGGVDTHLYQYAGVSDNGTAFSMEFTTPSLDQGQPRENKLYGDILLDADTDALNVNATPYFNNNATSAAAVTVNAANRTLTPIPFGSAWQTARNISMNVVVSISTSSRPTFYIWEPRWTFESAPISAYSWEISPSTFGMDNFKHVGICKITHVSSADISLIFTVDNVVQSTITIPNSGGTNYVQTIFRTPVYKGKLYKCRIASTAEWRLDPRDSFIEVKDWGSDGPYQRLRVWGDYSLVEG